MPCSPMLLLPPAQPWDRWWWFRDVVQALLSRGSKVNASDCMGTTALHIAVGMALREPEEERRALAWSVAVSGLPPSKQASKQ